MVKRQSRDSRVHDVTLQDCGPVASNTLFRGGGAANFDKECSLGIITNAGISGAKKWWEKMAVKNGA